MCNTRKTVLSATHTTAPRCVLMRDERRGRQRRRRGGSRQQVAEEREILSAHLPSGASLTFLPHFNALHVPVTSQGILQDYCPRSTRKDIRAALRDCVSRTCVPDTPGEERFLFFFHSRRNFCPPQSKRVERTVFECFVLVVEKKLIKIGDFENFSPRTILRSRRNSFGLLSASFFFYRYYYFDYLCNC